MARVPVAILFGGNNSEHDVSLMSSTSVLRNIDREEFEVIMLGITRDGRWLEYTGPVEHIIDGSWEQSPHVAPAFISPDRQVHGLVRLTADGPKTQRIDAAFAVMHGRYAEDGSMQGLFELAGIPLVGPGTCASAVCMDKEFSHILLEHAGIPAAKWICVHSCDNLTVGAVEADVTAKLGGYPVFVKPANAGSSVGVSKAKNREGLAEALALAFRHDRKAVIEEAIVGKEVESAVLGNDHPIAAQVLGEIVPKAEFYDYNAKYYDDATDLYIPARIDDETTQLVRDTAIRAYQALGCRGLSRVDFFVRGKGDIVLNELNTLPGLTNISMYPKLFTAGEMTYTQLISRLIRCALEED